MIASFVSLWLMAALGQNPGAGADAAWLKSVPADIDVVVQVRGLEAVRDDLATMLDALSPTLAAQAKPALQQGLDQFSTQFGKPAATAPFLVMLRFPKPEAIGTPPYGVIVKSDNYAGVLKSLAGAQGKATPKSEGDGVDSITGSDGLPLYTFKGKGFVAFSNDEALTRSIAKPKESLESRLASSLRSRLTGGDVGLYVNVASVQTRYGDQIDQFKQQVMTQLQNNPQMGNPQMAQPAIAMYGRLFDALKDGQALVLNFDFDASGLNLAGEAQARPDTKTGKSLTATETSPADALGKLPADLATYMFFNSGASMLEKLQNWTLQSAGGPGEKPSPEIEKAMEMQRQAGVKEMLVGSGLGAQGIKGISLSTYSDPKKAVEAITALAEATKTGKSPALAAIKSVKVEPNAQRYRGLTLTRSEVTFDLKKFAQLQPGVPNAEKMIKAMMGESLSTWYGTDGKVVVSAVAPDWDRAKAEIDAVQTGQGSVGKAAAYEKLRSKLPARVNGLIIISAQGIVQQMTQILGVLPEANGLKPPANMPKEPQFLGVAIVGTNGGTQFQVNIPSGVGEVFEKGFAPLVQGLQGKVNQ